ncbi:MAG: ATP-dependent metallopeptidase FtsH/Yme1/Tma family protein [Actinobacteria bacterium]|nr:MAG: ATP-dependent metallopeptidase FtsH/Yme1/Tma family protein [Actinomycetota bacterium]REK34736.1 MAG: ATP-dependent metallopeptidase FtsH/Yme1/Tma family protein [Actinomycetota bacterium]
MLALVAQWWFDQVAGPEEVTLSEFVSSMEAGDFESVQILERSNEVQARLEGSDAPEGAFDRFAPYPDGFEGQLTETAIASGTPVSTDSQPPGFFDYLISFLPWLFLLGFMVFIFMQMQGGGNRVMQFGKSRAKTVGKEQPKVTFDDVAGLQEAKEELEEIKDFLANPDKYRAIGAKIPKGVLLFGPPGTGKTLLAKAVAGEAGVPFMTISGSDFVEMFVGVGAARVRDLFEQAKQSAPAIVFIDEIDAVGRHRGAGLGGGHDEREQTLNQLLVELDGFEGNSGVIVMAATNRPDILDPALLRPGRFDRQIVVDAPDLEGRAAILEVHSKGKPLGKEIDLEVLARRTPGFTGADLANLINEAALLTARRKKKRIGMSELEEAIDRVIAGPERKTRVMTDDEKELIAYHETGHALVGYALPNSDPVHKVTIVARGRSLGHTLALPTHDKYLVRRSELVDQLAMLLGGRTAEELIFADPTSGAANDIEKATQIARRMVMEYGMSDELGPMQYGKANGEVFLGRDYSRQQDYSDEVAAFIDGEVRKMINAAHEEARAILSHHKDAMERMVSELLEHETVDRERVAEIFADVPKWEHTEEGSLRIRYPENPIIPQPMPRDQIAAAEEVEEPEEDVPSTTRAKKGFRPRSRPADAGA